MKIITKIEELDKKRSKVYINDEFTFVLYKGEIAQYKLKENEEIKSADYEFIQKQLLSKRAKKRCLNLLQKKAYTERNLRGKLEEGYYSKEIIEEAIEYVKSYHYVDDYEYACQYIFYHKESETKRKIEEKLKKKGIENDVLQKAFADSYEKEEEEEIELIQAQKMLQKKHYDAECMEWKEKQKIYCYLIRKGISAFIAKKAMAISIDDID